MRKTLITLAAILAAVTLSTGTAQATIVKPKCPVVTQKAPETHGWGKWKPVPTSVEQSIRHTDCIWLLGDTTYIVCKDGYMTSS